MDPIQVLADGTIKQRHPLSGTQVWTVPGRGNRPLSVGGPGRSHVGPVDRGVPCAFCLERADEVPPEKSRVVREGEHLRTLTGLGQGELTATTPEFRRLPNLFEIVSGEYWRDNHGHRPAPDEAARCAAWLADPTGRAQIERVLRARFLAAGNAADAWDALPEPDRLAHAFAFFSGGHDLIVGRRHLTDDGTTLASAGTLTHAEHAAFTAFTIDSIADLHTRIPAARYVATFQNWLAPAGASFDHLHKQLVAIDEHGAQVERELAHTASDPDAYARHLAYVRGQGLVLAENEHAVAFAAFGHRYPTLEVRARDGSLRPMEMDEAQVRGFSDLLHAMHVATGPDVPCNEEWQYAPLDVPTLMPWRVQIKWRISTLAGFEGGTRVFVTTLSPWDLRDRFTTALRDAADAGRLASSVTLLR